LPKEPNFVAKENWSKMQLSYHKLHKEGMLSAINPYNDFVYLDNVDIEGIGICVYYG